MARDFYLKNPTHIENTARRHRRCYGVGEHPGGGAKIRSQVKWLRHVGARYFVCIPVMVMFIACVYYETRKSRKRGPKGVNVKVR